MLQYQVHIREMHSSINLWLTLVQVQEDKAPAKNSAPVFILNFTPSWTKSIQQMTYLYVK